MFTLAPSTDKEFFFQLAKSVGLDMEDPLTARL